MRILHGPANISGMAGLLAVAQRARGHDALSVTSYNPTYKFFADLYLNEARGEPDFKVIDSKSFRSHYLESFEIYHFYFGLSYDGLGLGDFSRLAKSGKRVFMTFCGCDARDNKMTQQTYDESVCRRCWPTACSPNREIAIRLARKHAHAIFVSTVDLLDTIPEAIWMPQPVSLEKLPRRLNTYPKRFDRSRPLRIIHAPSDMGKKGSEHLVAAVERLRSDGAHIELNLLTGVSQRELYHHASIADIAVDQLVSGTYGSFAVEMMAIGLPTVCFMRDSWDSRFPEKPPLLNADKHSVENILRRVYLNELDIAKISEGGIAYVDDYHTADAVAARLENYYGKQNWKGRINSRQARNDAGLVTSSLGDKAAAT